MKLKLKQNLTINGKNNLKGSIVEVEEKDAKSILAREWATEVKEPKKVEEVAETAPKAKEEAKKATKPATTKKTPAKATKAPTAKKAVAKKAN